MMVYFILGMFAGAAVLLITMAFACANKNAESIDFMCYKILLYATKEDIKEIIKRYRCGELTITDMICKIESVFQYLEDNDD